MTAVKIIFFGSTHDSILVLEKLVACHLSHVSLKIVAVVTQPPRPTGRKRVLTPTPVESWAKEHDATNLSFPSDPKSPWLYANEQQVIDTLSALKADLIISACYGQKIPWLSIHATQFGGLNVHPSLLPRWRGADPVPWAILTGDHQAGVSVVTLSKNFDEGVVIAQKKIPITDKDTSDALRTKLFTIGAELLVKSLDSVIASAAKQSHHRLPRPLRGLAMTPIVYARRLTRDDGFLPWKLIRDAIDGKDSITIQSFGFVQDKQFNNITIVKDYIKYQDKWNKEDSLGMIIDRFHRALSPWPGIWTLIETRPPAGGSRLENRQMRLKIISCHLVPTPETRLPKLVIDSVQLEGKTPVPFSQFSSSYLSYEITN